MLNTLIFILIFFPAVLALFCYYLGSKNEKKVFPIVIAVSFICLVISAFLYTYPHVTELKIPIMPDFPLSFKADSFRSLYALACSFLWTISSLYSPPYFYDIHKKPRYGMFSLLSLSTALGVFLSADLYTSFLFFEILSFVSYPLVSHEETEDALIAGRSYIATAVLGGMLVLLGMMYLYPKTGSFSYDVIFEKAQLLENKNTLILPATLILLGFGAKAGMFPVHGWLPLAHPVAPAPASAVLSGMLTKVGVFGILHISFSLMSGFVPWGNILLVFGLITMVLGALLALFSTNLKRTLACSSMSQIGFILVGISMQILLNNHSAIAMEGTIMHMLNHSLVKLCLFLCAGYVYMLNGSLSLNDVKGSGRGYPLLNLCFLVGALSISGIPLFSGYPSKTLLHEGMVEYIMLLEPASLAHTLYTTAEWIFIISGGITFAYMIKLYFCIFIAKPEKAQNKQSIPSLIKITLVISAIVLIPLGLFPNAIMEKIAIAAIPTFVRGVETHAVEYFSNINIMGTVKSLIIGAIIYITFVNIILIKRKDGKIYYVDRTPKLLEIDTILKPIWNRIKSAGFFVAEKLNLIAEKL